jgi:hypothetical protein
MYSSLVRDIKKVRELKDSYAKELMAIILTKNLIEEETNAKYLIHLFKDPLKTIKKLEENHDLDNVYAEKRFKLPLGKYAEFLFGEGLKANADFTLLAQNFQINKDHRTIGEIDFLLQSKSHGKYYHIEFAQKYYLKTVYKNQIRFLGPSAKDWLEKKMEKMTLQQLSITDKFKNLLPDHLSNFKFEKKIIMKGSLFLPLEEYSPAKASLALGWWAYNIVLKENFSNNEFYFKAIFNRKDWIFPFDAKEKIYSASILYKELEENPLIQNGLMVVRYNKKMEVIDRGFLMKSNWPNS